MVFPSPTSSARNGALGERAAKGEQRRLDLMRIEVDLRVGQNRGELLDAVRRAASTELVGEVLGVEVGDHEQGALPMSSRGSDRARDLCIRHPTCAAQRAVLSPMVVLTYECCRSLPSEGDGGGARGEQRTQRRRRPAASTRFATRARVQHVTLHVGAMGVYSHQKHGRRLGR